MPYKPRQRGVSLIEVLIAVLIFSIGLIGLAGLMVVSTRSNHVAYLRTQVTFLANNMAERMSANPRGVWSGAYNNGSYPVGAGSVTCSAGSPCSPADLAVYDQQSWSNQLRTFLPNPTASIVCAGVTAVSYNPIGNLPQRPPYGGNCVMEINWTERSERGQAPLHGDNVQTFVWNFQP